jgi:hypothetical protein
VGGDGSFLKVEVGFGKGLVTANNDLTFVVELTKVIRGSGGGGGVVEVEGVGEGGGEKIPMLV